MKYHTPLSTDELRTLGIPEPWTYGLADRTRFGEIDALNHINHTAYLRWFEAFRIRYFFDYGISDYGPDAPRLVLRQVGADYLAEMGLNQDYIITGRTANLRNTSFRMEYGVWSEGRLTATGHSIVVMLTQDGQKLAIPESARETLQRRDDATAL